MCHHSGSAEWLVHDARLPHSSVSPSFHEGHNALFDGHVGDGGGAGGGNGGGFGLRPRRRSFVASVLRREGRASGKRGTFACRAGWGGAGARA